MSEIIEINQQRIHYLVKLFGLDKREFLSRISAGLKQPLTNEQIFQSHIQLSHLKKIDKVFKKGLSFYTDPTPIEEEKSASIFFRKNRFNSPLEIGDRKIVSKVEDEIASITGLVRLSTAQNLIKRKIKTYKVKDCPIEVAKQIRAQFNLESLSIESDRDFLKALIGVFAENNIFVHEFVEQWNLIDKANLNGFFIAPNHIAIKRNQKALKREIFTLAHELGHYLLNQEEIDHIDFEQQSTNAIEKWCNKFAFYFLIKEGDYEKLSELGNESIVFDDQTIFAISKSSHISRLALFTHLAGCKKISWEQYAKIKNDINEQYREKQRQQELEKRRVKELGIATQGGGSPKPIKSPLVKEVYINAFLEGVVSEYQVLTHCAPVNKKVSIEDIIYG
jgi:Zn-dependent peptidase ImmA (M78 family)